MVIWLRLRQREISTQNARIASAEGARTNFKAMCGGEPYSAQQVCSLARVSGAGFISIYSVFLHPLKTVGANL